MWSDGPEVIEEEAARPYVEPRVSFEEIEIWTADGVSLRAIVEDPAPGRSLRGTVILAHAMFTRKSVFGRRDRSGLASALVDQGFRTVAFDFRGHGESRADDWGYDDLVRFDLPAVVGCARARLEDRPVIVAGHSLGGHVALAAQGTKRIEADAIVAIATNVWMRAFEPSRARWAVKTAIAHSLLALADRASGIPARRFRFGTDDASLPYIRDFFAGVTADWWGSRDRSEDYLASLRQVTAPVAAVLGTRDRVMCHSRSGEAFARRCGGRVAFFHAPADHMELVKSEPGMKAVTDAVEWATEAAAQARP
jgi:alpha-beta hydrolase superfamily lysophospholipase